MRIIRESESFNYLFSKLATCTFYLFCNLPFSNCDNTKLSHEFSIQVDILAAEYFTRLPVCY